MRTLHLVQSAGFLAVLVLLVSLVTPVTAQAQSEAETSFESEYSSLLTNNLFLRERQPPRSERPVSRPPPPPPPPEKQWRLVGIVFEEGLFRAYFEHTDTGRVTRVAPGDTIATGQIGDVFIDSVSYLADGDIIWIDFGEDLTGVLVGAGARTARRDGGPGEERGASRGASATGEGANLDVLEQMRLRRQQETGSRGRDQDRRENGRESGEEAARAAEAAAQAAVLIAMEVEAAQEDQDDQEVDENEDPEDPEQSE